MRKVLLRIWYLLINLHITDVLSDESFLRIAYWIRIGKTLNLENPKTYNEKIQWLKLYDHNPLYTIMVDKYAVKKYVAGLIGEEYIIPTLAVWDTVNDIDFRTLPEKFVIKCTHDSGGVCIKNNSDFNESKTLKKLSHCMKRNFYMTGREWAYKNMKPQIIAEEYMEDNKTHELRDYKFFCFDGRPMFLFIATDRQNRKEPYFDFYDMQFNHLSLKHGHPNAPREPERPMNFELMKEISAKLSKGIPHVRVDLYEINGKVYFGELTFYHHAGFVNFEPKEWDVIFGDLIKLPII